MVRTQERACSLIFAGEATLKTPLPPQVMTEGLASYIRGHRVKVIPLKDRAQAVDVFSVTLPATPEQRRVHRMQVSIKKRRCPGGE